MEGEEDGAQDDGVVLCSKCFLNEGLKIEAAKLGLKSDEACPRCGAFDGLKLSTQRAKHLAHRFFVVGSLHKTRYGGAPVIQFNSHQKTDLKPNTFHDDDIAILSKVLGIGFFYYGPPLWAVGYIEPLEALEEPNTRDPIINRILHEYPKVTLAPERLFYRLRKGVAFPEVETEYDSPPEGCMGGGRLDSPELPILYGSTDLELCIHECRVTVEDQLHVATLMATQPLTLLDLTALLNEKVSPFESLDMAVHLLFLAANHSYPISRAIAAAAAKAGFDGILFPSYFSLLRTGRPFLETAYGLSIRTYPGTGRYEALKIVENVALFGRPISDRKVKIVCINRLYLRQAAYDLGFGPAIN